MNTYIECIGCLVKQAVEIAKAHVPEDMQDDFMRDILRTISEIDYSNPPPILATLMYSKVSELTGVNDPYKEIKSYYNEKALGYYPEMKDIVESSDDPFETALRVAVAGNIIDFGIGTKDSIQIGKTVERALRESFAVNHINELKDRLSAAKNVLYLADNAGEIVFDRLFIEQIGPERVVCAFRHAPIINDATLEDAAQVGIEGLCRVMSSGSCAPGTPISLCSDEFKDLFEKADVVISKGQGNFETLSDASREIFFLFMAKCHVISAEVGVPTGSFIAMRSVNQVS